MMRLCTICARGGSKGVPGKNLRELGGKPLIAHSILQAKGSGMFDAVTVDSDSDDILRAAKEWGADHLVVRPADLAADDAPKVGAIRHAVEETERVSGSRFDILCDLDATSPLRDVSDIREAVELLESKGVGNVLTGAPSRRSPYFNLVEVDADGRAHLSKVADPPVTRRQDAPPCFDMNASIYVWRRDALFGDTPLFGPDTALFVMPEERSHDIDSELDFEIVEFLLGRKARHG